MRVYLRISETALYKSGEQWQGIFIGLTQLWHSSSVRYSTGKPSAVPCSTVQCIELQQDVTHCSAVQRGVMQCSALQPCVMHCSAVQRGLMQCSAVQRDVMHCSAVQRDVLHSSVIQCSTIQLTAVWACRGSVWLIK